MRPTSAAASRTARGVLCRQGSLAGPGRPALRGRDLMSGLLLKVTSCITCVRPTGRQGIAALQTKELLRALQTKEFPPHKLVITPGFSDRRN